VTESTQTRDFSNEELVAALVGDSLDEIRDVLAACRERPGVARDVSALLRLEGGLAVIYSASSGIDSTADRLALYLFEPESLNALETARLELRLEVEPELRAELEAMRRFSASPAAAALRDSRAFAPRAAARAARPTDATQPPSRRIAAMIAALLVPALGYAGYIAYNAVFAGSESTQSALEREQPSHDRTRSSTRSDDPLNPETADTRTRERALQSEATTPPARVAGELRFALRLGGLGLTNPDAICEGLGLGSWQPDSEALGPCSEPQILAVLGTSLEHAFSAAKQTRERLLDAAVDVNVLRVRQTADGALRIRSEVSFPRSPGQTWRMHAAFEPAASQRLAFLGAVIAPDDICEWGDSRDLPLCEVYSRFIAALIKAAPAHEIFTIEQLDAREATRPAEVESTLESWSNADRVRVRMERDEELAPHWTVVSD
jgi:hypothetical protein